MGLPLNSFVILKSFAKGIAGACIKQFAAEYDLYCVSRKRYMIRGNTYRFGSRPPTKCYRPIDSSEYRTKNRKR